MRILVAGAGGMLGQDVVVQAQAGDHEVVALTRADLDVTNARAVSATIAAERPEAIINCAAWTDVDGAEAHEEAALELNGHAPELLARAATEIGAQLVHVSTDYVFDGSPELHDGTSQPRPYVESDATGPRTAYGRTKLAGEQGVLAAGQSHAVIRTAWLFGAGGKNFVATMLAAAAGGREELAVVTDQVGCPTYSGHLAGALVDVAERRIGGIQHVAGSGQCSWNGFAREIFEQAGVRCEVRAIESSEYPLPAPRPAWSVLVSERPEVPRLPDWREGLAAYLSDVREELSR
jgi:dTDP-4-dehydrorhamnose reductase